MRRCASSRRAPRLPFAGHPNVGTGYVLAQRDDNPPEHYVFEELAGLVRVHVLRSGNVISGARISAPRALSIDIGIPDDVVAACAGLAADDIATDARMHRWLPRWERRLSSRKSPAWRRCRAPVPISAHSALAAERFPEVATRFSLLLYARRDGDATRLAARMFAPLGGIMEDPATGSANAALAALLTSLAPGENADLSYEILQGVEMGRPSQIIASARKTAEGPVLATVEGSCVPVLRGSVEL